MTDCVDHLISIWKQRFENKKDAICTCLVDDNQQLMLDMFTLLTFDYDLGNLKRLSEAASLSNRGEKSKLSEFSQALSIWLNGFKRVTVNGMPLIVNYYLLKFDRTYQKALKTLENYAEKVIAKCQQETDLNKKPINLVASLVSSLQKDEVLEQSKCETEKNRNFEKRIVG
ncbi:unnamed protein product [Rotaria sp. Silwood2]|nr:unnamed protein product [Rotaria sp. Silwood2]